LYSHANDTMLAHQVFLTNQVLQLGRAHAFGQRGGISNHIAKKIKKALITNPTPINIINEKKKSMYLKIVFPQPC
jgi:hypothetical protein